MRLVLWMTVLPAIAACATHPAAEKAAPAAAPAAAGLTAPAPPAPAPHQAAIGEFGIDLSARNPAVKPGDDFFAYANGTWYDAFTIPPDKPWYGSFNKLDDLSKDRVREIIEHAAAAHAATGTPEQQIGDYFAAFMDEAAIEANGLAPAQPDLDRIAAARTAADIARLFGEPGFASLFDAQLPPDFKNTHRYCVFITQSTLGLPDRDYYLKDDAKLKELRTAYVAYIAQMLALGGVNAATAAQQAHAVMAFETEAARAQWSLERRRDVSAIYNPRSKPQLLAFAPGFPWQEFLEPLNLGAREDLVLGELSAIHDLGALFAQTPPATLRAFLTFHYLNSHAAYLPKRFDDAHFAFYGEAMRGQPQQRERWKRAVDAVDDSLGEAVGRLYVAQYFPPESKAKMQQLVADLEAALSERIDALDWMTPQTKARAHEKLAAFTPKIGYPEKWKDYSQLTVRRDDLLGNVRRAAQWQWNYQVERLDKPVDRAEWQMTPQEINAYYNPSNNEIVFPAAILQPPFFDPNADAAVNFGGIGAVIGHEISHAFDDQGRKYDGSGNLRDWWTQQDVQRFTARTQALTAQYSAYEPLPGEHINGELTLGENIADLSGLTVAMRAYQLSLGDRAAPMMDGFTGEQRFFLGWAQAWRGKIRDKDLRVQLLSDPHSPNEFRANGVVSNLPDFYSAFGVKEGDRLYRAPDQRVKIW